MKSTSKEIVRNLLVIDNSQSNNAYSKTYVSNKHTKLRLDILLYRLTYIRQLKCLLPFIYINETFLSIYLYKCIGTLIKNIAQSNVLVTNFQINALVCKGS